MATTKDILRSCSIIAFALSFGACTATGEVDDNAAETMNNASNVVDMNTTPDLGDAPNTTPTMADMGSMTTPSPEDMGSEPGPMVDMSIEDMGQAFDMAMMDPDDVHIGTSCDANGQMGSCQRAAQCPSPNQHVPGFCPGSSAVRCCVEAGEDHVAAVVAGELREGAGARSERRGGASPLAFTYSCT